MKNADFLENLLEVSRTLAGMRDVQAALRYLVQVALSYVDAQRGFVVLFAEEDAQALSFRVKVDFTHDDQPIAEEVSRSILQQVRASGEAVRIADALNDAGLRGAPSVQALQLRSILCVPLAMQDVVIGAIYAENRARPNAFSRGDLATLAFFSGQTAVLVHNAILTEHLAESRAALVTAREEERRRVRRDLHDGVGPMLAGMAAQLQAAENLLAHDGETAREALRTARQTAQMALQDIRRIVYDLRPPALDELGLVSALRETIGQLAHGEALQVRLEVSEEAPHLAAALEVAVFLIVREALYNVLRHAGARHCHIRLAIGDPIALTIDDDGRGFPPHLRGGVGLRSIRERVAELRGSAHFARSPLGGARVRIHLPYAAVNHAHAPIDPIDPIDPIE